MNINLTLIAQAISFAVFILFTVKFVWPPLMKAIEERQKQIADGLAAGEQGKQQLEASGKLASEEVGKAREIRHTIARIKTIKAQKSKAPIKKAKAKGKVAGKK